MVCNDILQHPHPLRPKTAKIESRPQARHWRSHKTVAEGDRSSAIVENHSQLEAITAGLRQLPEPLEVTSIHARLDFDTDQCTTPSFNHEVNLVLVLVPVVIQSAASPQTTTPVSTPRRKQMSPAAVRRSNGLLQSALWWPPRVRRGGRNQGNAAWLVAVHAISTGSIQRGIDGGGDCIEHGNDVTDEQLKAMRDKGIFIDITPNSWGGFFAKIAEPTIVMSAAMKAELATSDDRRRQKVATFIQGVLKSGVKFAGSDMWWFYPGKTRGQARREPRIA
jgi:hypothetical protein